MAICCVPRCKSRSDNGKNTDTNGNKITFHEFPINPERRQLWTNILRNQGYNSMDSWCPLGLYRAMVCSLHFRANDFRSGFKKKILVSDAVPCIFEYVKIRPKEYTVETREERMPIITDVRGNFSSTDNAIEHKMPQEITSGRVIHFYSLQSNKLTSILNSQYMLPVGQNLVPKYPACLENTPKEQGVGSGKKENPTIKIPSNGISVTDHFPLGELPAQASVINNSVNSANSMTTTVKDNTLSKDNAAHIPSYVLPAKPSVITGSAKSSKSKDITVKDNSSSLVKHFTYHKLLKKISRVEKPNQFWGVTPTDKFTIFSRWNEKYIPEKRVIVDNTLSVKVFLAELEINVMNLMELKSVDDVSALLEKVEGFKIVKEEPGIDHNN